MRRRRALAVAVAVWAFLVIWVSAVSSGLAGAKCPKFHLPAEERLASCRWDNRLGLPLALILPRAERATGWVAEGAALADLGQDAAARALYRQALDAVRLTPPVDIARDVPRAQDRAVRVIALGSALPEGSAARATFVAVLAGGR